MVANYPNSISEKEEECTKFENSDFKVHPTMLSSVENHIVFLAEPRTEDDKVNTNMIGILSTDGFKYLDIISDNFHNNGVFINLNSLEGFTYVVWYDPTYDASAILKMNWDDGLCDEIKLNYRDDNVNTIDSSIKYDSVAVTDNNLGVRSKGEWELLYTEGE